jgi:hypothetical protein
MNATIKNHLAAIQKGVVTKTNVIGIRKTIAHAERLRRGWSGNRLNATPADADALEAALSKSKPVVVGALHDSGVKLLQSKRYAGRFTERQARAINSIRKFRLLRFDRVGDREQALVPVYLALSPFGSFAFRNIPWQTAYYAGEESGPVVVEAK